MSFFEYEKPDFPKALLGLPYFSDIFAACDGQTEASHSFLFASGLIAASSILGRRVGVESFPKALFPNLYIVFVAESGGSRKSSVLGFTKELLSHADPSVLMIENIATPEGLVRQFALPRGKKHGTSDWQIPGYIEDIEDTEKQSKRRNDFISQCLNTPEGIDRYIKERETIDWMLECSSAHEGFRALATIDEMAGLLKKAKSGTADGLLTKISEFYSAQNRVSNTTSTTPTTAFNPCLNLMGAIPAAWLDTNLSSEDIAGGIGRRMQFVSDTPTAPVVMPKPAKKEPFDKAVTVLSQLRTRFDTETLFTFSEEALETLTLWYHDFKSDLKAEERLLFTSLREGQDQHVRKLALILATLDEQTTAIEPVIRNEHLGYALEWTNYVLACQFNIFSEYVETSPEKNERAVRKVLERNSGQWVDSRTLYRSAHLSAKITNEVLEAFLNSGTVEHEQRDATNGRLMHYWRLAKP